MANETDKTQAIVLSTVPINDHSQFVHLYTEQYGRMTCRIPLASKGKRANRLRTMMTPMTVLDLVFKGNPSDDIRSIGEAQIVQSPYMLTLSHPDKSAQCLYMAELIAHTVREEEANPRLWDYILASLTILLHTASASIPAIMSKGVASTLSKASSPQTPSSIPITSTRNLPDGSASSSTRITTRCSSSTSIVQGATICSTPCSFSWASTSLKWGV